MPDVGLSSRKGIPPIRLPREKIPKFPLKLRKRIVVVHSQLLCVDGVSMETEKWIKAYRALGHKVFLVAGKFCSEPKLPFKVIPELALDHPTVESIKKMAFEAPWGRTKAKLCET